MTFHLRSLLSVLGTLYRAYTSTIALTIAKQRLLTEDKDVWSQNAWDHVPPPEGQEEIIERSLSNQRTAPVPHAEKIQYNAHPAKHW